MTENEIGTLLVDAGSSRSADAYFGFVFGGEVDRGGSWG
jgi:hypothetical protein